MKKFDFMRWNTCWILHEWTDCSWLFRNRNYTCWMFLRRSDKAAGVNDNVGCQLLLDFVLIQMENLINTQWKLWEEKFEQRNFYKSRRSLRKDKKFKFNGLICYRNIYGFRCLFLKKLIIFQFLFNLYFVCVVSHFCNLEIFWRHLQSSTTPKPSFLSSSEVFLLS